VQTKESRREIRHDGGEYSTEVTVAAKVPQEDVPEKEVNNSTSVTKATAETAAVQMHSSNLRHDEEEVLATAREKE
jgi:hypothetical protein